MFFGFFLLHSFAPELQFGLGLQSHDSATPLSDVVNVVVEFLIGQALEEVELGSILLVDSGQSNNGSSLLVNECTKTGLVLNDHVRNLHLTAKSRHPHDKLNGVNIAGNQDKLSLFLLNEGGDVLQTEFDLEGDLSRVSRSRSSFCSSLLDSLLLGSSSLRTVVVEEFENSHSLVLSNGLGELVDGRRDLKTLVDYGTLPLDTDVLGPSDETAQVFSPVADVTSDSGGTGPGREKRVCLLGRSRGSALLGSFLSSLYFINLGKEKNQIDETISYKRKVLHHTIAIRL